MFDLLFKDTLQRNATNKCLFIHKKQSKYEHVSDAIMYDLVCIYLLCTLNNVIGRLFPKKQLTENIYTLTSCIQNKITDVMIRQINVHRVH